VKKSELRKLISTLVHEITEERDYKDEYKKFQSSDKMKKYRAELNKYNRKKGTYGNGDKKDASHKGGKIVGFEEESKIILPLMLEWDSVLLGYVLVYEYYYRNF